MQLIDKTGFVADSWMRACDEVLPQADSIIVPYAQLEDLKILHVKKIGIHVANTVRPAELVPYFNQIALISIDFPSFSDGRGFSLARVIRSAGFTGELRAYGPLIADQYAFALSCGFDTLEIPENLAKRQPEVQWKAAFTSLSASYQRSFAHGVNILDQRRTEAG